MIPQEEKSRTMSRLNVAEARQDRMDSLVVKVQRGIMHSNSQLTDCFVSLALRRAAHDCITGDGSSGAALRLC